ncbi:Rv3235 family protein [Streptomyces xiamenensis]
MRASTSGFDRRPRPGAGPAPRTRRTDSRRPGVPLPRTAGGARTPQHWFAERLLLILSGRRPVHLLMGHTTAEAYEALIHAADHAPFAFSGTPVLRRVGATQPAPGAVEAFARVTVGERTRAIAFRLEQTPAGSWRCAALELDTMNPGHQDPPHPTAPPRHRSDGRRR